MIKVVVLATLCLFQLACGDTDGIISPVPSPTGNIDHSGTPTGGEGDPGGNGGVIDSDDPGLYVDVAAPTAEPDTANLDNDNDPAAEMSDSVGAGEQNDMDCRPWNSDVAGDDHGDAECDGEQERDQESPPTSPGRRKRGVP
ncbi:MAG: hypothetical protein HUU55_14525 [Myxococcales bacterium]|nr:hypothetical protein [Myxococcales bacterium]